MNTWSIEQLATILNDVVEQATGQKNLTAITNENDLITVAQTALLAPGYDPIINAISQVWSRTLFAYRDYNASLASLEFDLPRWGNAVRKLSPIAGEMLDDERFTYPVGYDAVNYPLNPLGTGLSVDHYRINKQEVMQTNFYGQGVYEQVYTIFKDQFDVAFNSAEEFGRFLSMCMSERKNDRESYKEGVAHNLQANFVGALIDEAASDRVIHALTEYNAATNLSLTDQTVFQPANFPGFMRWLYARCVVIARLMSKRSTMFQTNITGKTILRHTPKDKVRVAIHTPFAEMMKSMVLATTFNEQYLTADNFEEVDYWQSLDAPDEISLTPVYTDTSGAIATASAVAQDKIIGLIHDRDALGYAFVNQWAATTPLNILGGYWNEAHHANVKTLQDNTEKAVVLILD